jgi:AcrR family transcriptional regulator
MAIKETIVNAALETIKTEGFAGTSARAIARNGDFNQALIFYHFGTLNDLLLAALDRTSEQRMLRYREVLNDAGSIPEIVEAAMKAYGEDLEAGHITVLSEMIAGSLSRPDLGPEIVARMEPWIDFAEEAVKKAVDGTPFASILPPRTVAFAIVALYLGVDLLAHLDRDHSRAEDMFKTAAGIADLLAPMLGSTK